MTWRPFPDEGAVVAPLLVVSELRRSLSFYVDLLGASELSSWDTYAQLRLGGGRPHLVAPSPGTEDKPGIGLVAPTDSTSLTGESSSSRQRLPPGLRLAPQ